MSFFDRRFGLTDVALTLIYSCLMNLMCLLNLICRQRIFPIKATHIRKWDHIPYTRFHRKPSFQRKTTLQPTAANKTHAALTFPVNRPNNIRHRFARAGSQKRRRRPPRLKLRRAKSNKVKKMLDA